jgi:hypothetical protein
MYFTYSCLYVGTDVFRPRLEVVPRTHLRDLRLLYSFSSNIDGVMQATCCVTMSCIDIGPVQHPMPLPLTTGTARHQATSDLSAAIPPVSLLGAYDSQDDGASRNKGVKGRASGLST